MIRGLVFGKFHPPHRGHKLFIDAAAAQCDRLTVLLMASARETISGELRLAWLREMHPFADIRLVPDDMPQSWPADRDDLFAEFAGLVRAAHPEPIDRLFTSEWYGDLTARALNCAHVAIDPMRVAAHVSSTLVREDPVAHLADLAPAVRAWCVPRIVLVGAESTGKTTLARRLAAHYRAPAVWEFGREYTAWVGQTATVEYAWTPEDFAVIAREQQTREDEAARTATPLLICDTDVFATAIWERRYLGATHAPEVKPAQTGRRFYLSCAPDVAFVQDGTRDGEHVRATMSDWFERALDAGHERYATLMGTWDDRFARAVAFADQAIAAPIPLESPQ